MNSAKRKTILVTGATGFIGRHLVNRLRQDKGVHLILLTRRPVTSEPADITMVTTSLDRLSIDTWRSAGIDRIDLVFHLGGYIPKRAEEADRVEEIFRDNLTGTRSLLESLPVPPERIIFSSTVDVYAPIATNGTLNEDSALIPAGLYGASKLFCEHLVQAYAKTNGCGYAILRYGHIFGPGEEAYQKLIPEVIRGLLKGEAPILHGDGSAECDFLYVDDAVEATMRASSDRRMEMGPLNVVRGTAVTVKSVVEIVSRIMGFSGVISYNTDKPTGLSLRYDNRRLRETLGEWEFVTLEEGLDREVQYFKALHGN